MKYKNRITAHCLICNEERWIWYAIMSVISYVDQILVYDTGSSDNTVKIIKSIKSSKIILVKKGKVNKKEFTNLRQEMIDKTKTEWFLILDGDEIWTKAGIIELLSAINRKSNKNKQAIEVGQWACIGDVFHYSLPISLEKQPRCPKNLFGFRSVRVIKKISGIVCVGDYGYESFVDSKGIDLSRWKNNVKIFLKNKLFHMTFLPRSSSIKKDREVMMRAPKTLFYSGEPFPENISYPEVFYLDKPDMVSSPWKKFTFQDRLFGIYYRILNFFNRFID